MVAVVVVTGALIFPLPLPLPRRRHHLLSFPVSPLLPSGPRGRRVCPCRCRRSWDSNAESVRPSRFRSRGGGGGGVEEEAEVEDDDWGFWKRGRRKWWSDESYDELDKEDSELFGGGTVEQPWDKIWIFKVFKSYGFLLPAIIASLLLSTGPKAFLMALALPLGQSALSLAIEKLWGNVREEPRPRSKAKKKSFVDSTDGSEGQGGEESAGPSQGYQSWVAADVGAADKESDTRNSSFGGWDELDRRRGEPVRRQKPPRTRTAGSTQAQSMKKGKLSRRARNRDVPFFLRLLIAVFPFLGSWTRIL